jgi:hypothetical protein
MKFSDDLLKTVGAILEAKPRVSFDGDKATVHSKNGTAMKSFNKSDLGTSYRKHADNFLSQNYKKLNAESVIIEELEEAKQLELPGMEKKKPQQLELPLGDKKKDKKDMKESEDLNTDNAAKATMHDCAKHVRHEEFGFGQCISTMHTLEEDENGNGYVTHYDVMFKGEDGPFIKEDISVEELEIISEMHHGHPKGKKKKANEEVEAIDEKKGHKKDKGDMDGDGKDEPDDEEYMDNKDKAIKMSMSKKKSESPIKKVEEEIISEEAYEIADLILEYFPKEKIGQSKNYHIKSVDPEQGAYSLKHKKTGKKTTITVTDNHPFSRTRHINRDLQKNSPEVPGSDRHAVARHINKHIQHTGMDGSDPKKDKAGTGDVRRSLQKDGDSRKSMKESPTYVPGFIGADGKATSKPTKKDYDSNKEYQHMKKKLGDRIPGPPPVKKINKEHLDSISAALQEISNKTLGRYAKAAVQDRADRHGEKNYDYHYSGGNIGARSSEYHDGDDDKIDNRNHGINQAMNRMSSKKYGKSKPGKPNKLAKDVKESSEIQEISKGLAQKYVKKALKSVDDHDDASQEHTADANVNTGGNQYDLHKKNIVKKVADDTGYGHKDAKKAVKSARKDMKQADYHDRKSHNRYKGIDRAINRLARESYSGEPEHVVKQAKKDAEETRSKRLKGMFKGNKK